MGKDGDTPLVSVIIATYNWSSVLRYALLSVQAQTFRNFEVLVIGDGCSDDSEEIVRSLGDSRFRWDNLPVNHGHQSAPNNRGLSLAAGEWIAYLGHDDLWMPNHLELLLRKLDETGADVGFSLAMLVGTPGCDGRMLFPVFEGGKYERGSDIPPSVLMHRRSLVGSGKWPDHHVTQGTPEGVLLAGFHDRGAEFASVAEVTVFKFPSSWRPHCYTARSCEEQADFFRRMHNEPDFLHRELIELGLSTQLLKPHTRVPATRRQENLLPGAVIEGYRRTRGLTGDTPEEGLPRFVTTAAMAEALSTLVNEEIQRRQLDQFAVLEVFSAMDGRYSAERSTRTIVPIGRWARVQIPLKQISQGAPLRIDPCERPAIIEVAWVALRRNGCVKWSARGSGLDALTLGGDAFRVDLRRVLRIRSRGNDPIFYLPADVPAEAPLVFDCWLRISGLAEN
jgi:hypothetical protein